MNRHPFFILSARALAFLFLVMGFAGCSAQKVEKLKVGYIPISECAQLYVAKDMGFFEKEGLDVELISLAGGAPILDGIAAGSLDAGFSNVVSLVLRRARDAKFLSVFGGTYETHDHQNHAVLVRSSRWSDNPRVALSSARIALNTRKNIEELMVVKFLESIGMSASDVQLVEAPFPSMLPLLEAGTADAVSIVEPFITIAQHDTTSSFKWLCNQYLTTTSRTLVATYVASEQTLTTRQESIIKFKRAMQTATDYIRDNEGRSRQIIGKFVKIPPTLLTKIGLPEFGKDCEQSTLDTVIKDMATLGYLTDLRTPSSQEMIWNR